MHNVIGQADRMYDRRLVMLGPFQSAIPLPRCLGRSYYVSCHDAPLAADPAERPAVPARTAAQPRLQSGRERRRRQAADAILTRRRAYQGPRDLRLRLRRS